MKLQKMKIISHRGYWQNKEEKNTQIAFKRSFELNFGTETDVRDLDGELVISHDPAKEGAMYFSEFLNIYSATGNGLPLALNIKSDGLQELLKNQLEKFSGIDYFVFDMSIPDMIQYARHGIRYFARVSEYEPEDQVPESASGIWLDAFKTDWYDSDFLAKLSGERQICMVSPELHGRDHTKHWGMLRDSGIYLNYNLILCTDFPELAQEYFNEKY